MQGANFISDGYTQPGYVQSAERLHGSLRFRYRPVLSEERGRLADAAAATTAAGYLRQIAALLAEKLVAWDLADSLGNPVETSAANVLRIQPELLLKLQQIVLGAAASDADPLWSDEQLNRHAEEELAATV